MDPQVFQALKASTAVKAIVGTNPPRIWRSEVGRDEPRPLARPYAVWFVLSAVPENNLSDPPPVDRDTVQVDFYHPTQAGVKVLATAGRDALEIVGIMTGLVFDGRDVETTLYRRSLQFDFTGSH